MKQLWSAKWKGSIQPRKQRKFRHNAPLHVRHKFVSANLHPILRKEFGKRSMPLRKGDEVKIMRGSSKKFKGLVDSIDLKRGRVYVEGVKVKKVDGSEVLKPLEPSNLCITKMNLDDKKRQRALERAPRKDKTEKKESKKEAKPAKPPEKKPAGEPEKKVN